MTEEDEELEKLRKKRMAELQASREDQESKKQEREEFEDMKNQLLIRILSRDAKERLNRLKLGYPDLASAVENQFIMLYRSGRLQGEVDDPTLKKILAQIQPKKKDIKIVRK